LTFAGSQAGSVLWYQIGGAACQLEELSDLLVEFLHVDLEFGRDGIKWRVPIRLSKVFCGAYPAKQTLR
jgi:hypothetical protein